ncbi:MAG: hypothetical protein J6M44_04770, partial [Butyrivibrio sp.]|nr:hypothetical protein [Butyrivibrio sp.]
MKRDVVKRFLAGVVCAATVITSAVPVFAAENVIGSETESKTAEVAVTATVSSNFKVKLPMAIELEEQEEVGEFGPVFASPKTT